MTDAELITIEKINDFDVTFLKLGSGLRNGWICAYVRLDTPAEDIQYASETFREGNVIGIDTNHAFNVEMNIDEKMEDAKTQINDVINHYRRHAQAIHG